MHHFKLSFDRKLSSGTLWQIGIVCAIIVLCLTVSYTLLACTDDWDTFCQDKRISKFMLPIYLLMDQNLYNEIYLASEEVSSTGETVTHFYNDRLKFASGLTFLFGMIFLNGAVIAILSDFIKRRVDNYHNGRTHYLKKGHYLIMGYDDIVPSVITHILTKHPDAYILLLTSAPAEFIHEKMRESVAQRYLNHIVVNYGHRISKDYYKDICLEHAKEIYIAGDRRKPQHDALNVECVQSICAYLEGKQDHTVKRITCVFENLDTYTSFCTSDIFSDLTKGVHVEFVPYNFYVGWATQVFVRQHYETHRDTRLMAYPSVCGQGIRAVDDNKCVHLVFVGTSTFAVSFAREAAHLMHFPNFDGTNHRTRITFIDTNMEVEMQEIITRFRHLFDIQSYYYGDFTENGKHASELQDIRVNKELDTTDFLDVEFEFIKGDVFSQPVQNLLCKWHKDNGQYLSIFLAMSKQSKNFAISMNLPDELYENKADEWNTPIFIRQDDADNFVTLLQGQSRKKANPYGRLENGTLIGENRYGRYANIYPFGMNDTAFYLEEEAMRRAKLINYLYETANYDTNTFQPMTVLAATSDETLWQEAKKFWNTKTVAEKWSNMFFAYSIKYKLIYLRAARGLAIDDSSRDHEPLTEAEIQAVGRAEHNRWNVERLLMGYRKPLPEEDVYTLKENKDDDKETDEMKKLRKNKKLFIHAEIRPFDGEKGLSEKMQKLDTEFAQYIPWIIQKTQKKV